MPISGVNPSVWSDKSFLLTYKGRPKWTRASREDLRESREFHGELGGVAICSSGGATAGWANDGVQASR